MSCFDCAWKVRLGSMSVLRAMSDSVPYLRSPSPRCCATLFCSTFSATCAEYACSDSSLVLDDDLSGTTCVATVCTNDECCGDPGGQWISCLMGIALVFLRELDCPLCLVVPSPQLS